MNRPEQWTEVYPQVSWPGGPGVDPRPSEGGRDEQDHAQNVAGADAPARLAVAHRRGLRAGRGVRAGRSARRGSVPLAGTGTAGGGKGQGTALRDDAHAETG